MVLLFCCVRILRTPCQKSSHSHRSMKRIQNLSHFITAFLRITMTSVITLAIKIKKGCTPHAEVCTLLIIYHYSGSIIIPRNVSDVNFMGSDCHFVFSCPAFCFFFLRLNTIAMIDAAITNKTFQHNINSIIKESGLGMGILY